jgi:hypothetical protein
VHGFHRRDVRVVCGDCQDVVSHGLPSFPYRQGRLEFLRIRPDQQAYTGSIVVMSESSAVIVRTSSAMVVLLSVWLAHGGGDQAGLLGSDFGFDPLRAYTNWQFC